MITHSCIQHTDTRVTMAITCIICFFKDLKHFISGRIVVLVTAICYYIRTYYYEESPHGNLYSVRLTSYAFIIRSLLHSLLFDDTNMRSSLFLNHTFLPCDLLKGGTTIAVMHICMYIYYNVLTHCIYSMLLYVYLHSLTLAYVVY